MILYPDTSALVKKYVQEQQSTAVINAMDSYDALAISSVGYAEAMASFHRKLREKLYAPHQLHAKMREFKKDRQTFIVINPTSRLNAVIDEVLSKYALRGFDALHLSSALLLKRHLKEDTAFACFDSVLNRAARCEGFAIVSSE